MDTTITVTNCVIHSTAGRMGAVLNHDVIHRNFVSQCFVTSWFCPLRLVFVSSTHDWDLGLWEQQPSERIDSAGHEQRREPAVLKHDIQLVQHNLRRATTVTHSTFQNMIYATRDRWDGGSALILTQNWTQLTVQDCSFVNCSVLITKSQLDVIGGYVLLRGSSSKQHHSTLSVSMCSFIDWYPGNGSDKYQDGGGVGTYQTCASHSIVDSNFTLSGAKKQTFNGGFIAVCCQANTSSPLTISNCRLQGDGQTRGNCLYIFSCQFGLGGLSVSDTEIVNTNSVFKLSSITGVKPIVVTRSNLVCGSLIAESDVVTREDPLLFVDCTLDVFRVESLKNSPNFYFVGTFFHTSLNSNSIELLSIAGPYTAFQAYSCMFSNLTGTSSSVCLIQTNGSVLLEDCRFDLEPSNKADFHFIRASPLLLNTSSVDGCTSNREIRITSDGKTLTACPLIEIIETPNTKTEIKIQAETDQKGHPIETMDTLWPAIQSLGADSSTILSLSDGSFTENEILSIQADVEIIGNGTESVHVTLEESPRPHTTQLMAELTVKIGANLTLRSMTLIPYSPSSQLVIMNKEGLLSVKNVVVCGKHGRTTELFCLSAGMTRFSHSRISSVAASSALIIVSGNGSISLSDTLFLSISRTHTTSLDVSEQSGSCVEANTSGSISIHFCEFGGCSSNCRAGAIDIVSADSTSRVEMKGCRFDQNTAGSEMNEAERGDDVVLEGFNDEQLILNFATIESFTKLPFLVNDSHPHAPPPHTLHFSPIGLDVPLAWSSPNILCEARLSELTLQSLLGSRLHNNVHTAIITHFKYNESMTSFSLKNASVSVTLKSGSRIDITQPNAEIFELKNMAFSVDQDSSLSLTSVGITFASRTLAHPFIVSTGRSTLINSVTIDAGHREGGGAICVKGTTTADTPINLTRCLFEKNTAAFGNDVFVDDSVIGDKGPDRLKGCKGESWSSWPHLEVEGITKESNEDEWTRIATFIDFPQIQVSSYGTDDDNCRFSISNCRTLQHAFQYLKSFYPNNTAYPHSAYLNGNFTFAPMDLEEANLKLEGSIKAELESTLPAGSCMFTVGKGSRFRISLFKFQHKANHTLVSVTSSESWLELYGCDVIIQSGTYSQPLISSVGCELCLEAIWFNDGSSPPRVTFSVPLVSFLPTPPQDGGLGSTPFSMTGCFFKNLTLSNSSIIVVETSGDVIFKRNNYTGIESDLDEGKYVSLKGHNFKQQIIPENWANNYLNTTLALHVGEDTSLAENHKWRTGSLVYWMFSPLEGIAVNATDSGAVDHPNCGSSRFQCATLDSALESASLNSLEMITLSSPSSLERTMTVSGTRTVRSSDTTQRTITVSFDSSVTVEGGELSFLAIQFASAISSAFSNGENTRVDPLFIVESGSLSLASCSLSSFILASSPLISHLSGSLSLMSCELSSIDRLSGKGSILSTNMTSGMELTIDGVNFTSMPCSSESPAVLLNFSSVSPSSPFPHFCLTNLRFDGTEGQETTGHFVEIVGRNISNIISEGDTRFEGSYSNETNDNDLWSMDEDLNLSISMLFYLRRQEGPVGVSRGGYDMDRCRYVNVWCSSVERAISRTSDRVLSEIVLLKCSDLSQAVTLTNNVCLTKGEEAATLHVSSGGSLTTTALRSLFVTMLTLSLPPIQTAEAVIIVPDSSSATLNTIVVTSTGGSNATLVRVTGGKAEVTDCVIQSEMKENTNLIKIMGGKMSVDTLQVEGGIGLNCSIVWMTKGSVNVCGLWNIRSTEGHHSFSHFLLLNSIPLLLAQLVLALRRDNERMCIKNTD
ncbi:hypothetical protein BLNAU_1247 [Blattamonas nauphoetae]|uniref:Uncharacterized protein n=1 Tax=Blattamonas nauphoetae TaxID=2049346 RepID=A0ABQ9YIU5_9EUKA|nr:hypothetical protein BLNAU_1247 [Blattamonas nauphoetae]